jgi:hypothetical protein
MPSRLSSLAALLLLTLTGPALAQGSLFDKGQDLLKGFSLKPPGGDKAALGEAEIAKGLREALTVGADRVVSALGKANAFNRSPELHIPLPPTLKSVQTALGRVGMSGLADDLELRLNRAAEEAVPRARPIFMDAIRKMTLTDARGILNGPSDSATRYFRDRMSAPLSGAMRPVVESALAQVGAVATYDRMIGQYKSLPFVPDAKADLTGYVLDKALAGVFLYLGREEAAIRANPAARSTELLKKVFGGG